MFKATCWGGDEFTHKCAFPNVKLAKGRSSDRRHSGPLREPDRSCSGNILAIAKPQAEEALRTFLINTLLMNMLHAFQVHSQLESNPPLSASCPSSHLGPCKDGRVMTSLLPIAACGTLGKWRAQRRRAQTA